MVNIKRKILLSIIILIIILQGLFLFSCNSEDEITYEEKVQNFTREWMNYLDDGALLNEIIIPGSHNAGTYGMPVIAENQSNTIYEQLCKGIRYFDIRIKDQNSVLVNYHSIVNGAPFSEVVADIKRFIYEHPDQFFILDFTLSASIELRMWQILNSELDFSKNSLKADTNIDELTMGAIRASGAKFMALFNCFIPYGQDQYIFRRDSALISPYREYYHYLDKDNLITQGFPIYFAEAEQNSKLFVLQSQRTANIIISPRQLEDLFHSYINDYLSNLTDSRTLDELNIVMRDFTDVDINNIKLILKLNNLKGTLKPDSREEFINILDIIE